MGMITLEDLDFRLDQYQIFDDYKREEIKKYVLLGNSFTDPFLVALFSNNLAGAINSANYQDYNIIGLYVGLLLGLPKECWGSLNALVNWQRRFKNNNEAKED